MFDDLKYFSLRADAVSKQAQWATHSAAARVHGALAKACRDRVAAAGRHVRLERA